MEKKIGTICIVNKAIFTKDDNHPKGFTIPVNTRLIINFITDKYFYCTLDSGYKIGIQLDYDCCLTIITDNKKILKFKEQLANNNTLVKLDFKTCTIEEIISESNKYSKHNQTKEENDYFDELVTEQVNRKQIKLEEFNKKIKDNHFYGATKEIDEVKAKQLSDAQKVIIKRKVWTMEVLEMSDGTTNMNRTNDGFNISELMGLAHFLQMELLNQWHGNDIKPDIIKRTVIID